jgi:hypothetical protein
MLKRDVIPNEVRDPTNGGGPHNEIRISKAPLPCKNSRSPERSAQARACPELVEGLRMTGVVL